MNLPRENMRQYLITAIRAQEVFERERLGYSSDSGFLGGMRDTLEEVERGEQIHLTD